jgi:hypothetical protein
MRAIGTCKPAMLAASRDQHKRYVTGLAIHRYSMNSVEQMQRRHERNVNVSRRMSEARKMNRRRVEGNPGRPTRRIERRDGVRGHCGDPGVRPSTQPDRAASLGNTLERTIEKA